MTFPVFLQAGGILAASSDTGGVYTGGGFLIMLCNLAVVRTVWSGVRTRAGTNRSLLLTQRRRVCGRYECMSGARQMGLKSLAAARLQSVYRDQNLLGAGLTGLV